MEVALSSAAEAFAAAYRYGVTAPGGAAGGGDTLYRLYEAADGWIAVAALETHFRSRLAEGLGLDELGAAEWEAWARELDLPVAALGGP